MTLSNRIGMVAAFLVAPLALSAQTLPKFGGLVQLWYNQDLNTDLRNNSAAPMGYYNLRSEFKQNGFALRRTEINMGGSVLPAIDL